MNKTEKYTINEIRNKALPVFKKYGINEVYLFGSYARGTSTNLSDIDFFSYNKGNVNSYFIKGDLKSDLEAALNKECDILFAHVNNKEFVSNIEKEGLIKLF